MCIFLPEEAAPSAGGGALPREQVELPLGVLVGGGHAVYTDAAAGDRPHLPDLVDLAGAVGELQLPEHLDAAVGADLGGEVGRLVGDGPRRAERVPRDGVRLDAVRAAAAAWRGDERLRAVHAAAGGVDPPGDPPAGRGRRGDERHGEGRRRRVVGPVHGRAQRGQVAARRVHAVLGELLRRARPLRGHARRRRDQGRRGQ